MKKTSIPILGFPCAEAVGWGVFDKDIDYNGRPFIEGSVCSFLCQDKDFSLEDIRSFDTKLSDLANGVFKDSDSSEDPDFSYLCMDTGSGITLLIGCVAQRCIHEINKKGLLKEIKTPHSVISIEEAHEGFWKNLIHQIDINRRTTPTAALLKKNVFDLIDEGLENMQWQGTPSRLQTYDKAVALIKSEILEQKLEYMTSLSKKIEVLNHIGITTSFDDDPMLNILDIEKEESLGILETGLHSSLLITLPYDQTDGKKLPTVSFPIKVLKQIKKWRKDLSCYRKWGRFINNKNPNEEDIAEAVEFMKDFPYVLSIYGDILRGSIHVSSRDSKELFAHKVDKILRAEGINLSASKNLLRSVFLVATVLCNSYLLYRAVKKAYHQIKWDLYDIETNTTTEEDLENEQVHTEKNLEDA